MVEWWSSLSTLMKALWGITLSASLIFVIQTIMTFLGADSDFDTDFSGDFSGDVPGDISGDFAGDGADAGSGMGLLTFRNFINFMLGFGWTAVLLRGSIQSNTLLFTIAIIVGVILVILVMLLFKWLASMQQSGNIHPRRQERGGKGTDNHKQFSARIRCRHGRGNPAHRQGHSRG